MGKKPGGRPPGIASKIEAEETVSGKYWRAILNGRTAQDFRTTVTVTALREYINTKGENLAGMLVGNLPLDRIDEAAQKALGTHLAHLVLAIQERNGSELRSLAKVVEWSDEECKLKPDLVRTFLIDKYCPRTGDGWVKPPVPTLRQLQDEIKAAVANDDGTDRVVPENVISRLCQDLEIEVKLSARGAPRGPREKQQ